MIFCYFQSESLFKSLTLYNIRFDSKRLRQSSTGFSLKGDCILIYFKLAYQ